MYWLTIRIRSDNTICPNTNTLFGPLFGTEANIRYIPIEYTTSALYPHYHCHCHNAPVISLDILHSITEISFWFSWLGRRPFHIGKLYINQPCCLRYNNLWYCIFHSIWQTAIVINIQSIIIISCLIIVPLFYWQNIQDFSRTPRKIFHDLFGAHECLNM